MNPNKKTCFHYVGVILTPCHNHPDIWFHNAFLPSHSACVCLWRTAPFHSLRFDRMALMKNDEESNTYVDTKLMSATP